MNPCILVFGMPRSGTTWIGKLFDSHPDTLYRHEPDSVVKLHVPLFPTKEDAPRYREALQGFAASLTGFRDPEVVGKQPLFPKSYQSAAGLFAYRASVLAAKAASRVRRHVPCVCRPTGGGYPQVRVVWKSIESCTRLGICVEALPDARAIYLLRHPCGYVASQLRGAAGHHFASPDETVNSNWVLERLLEAPAGQAHRHAVGDVKRLAPEERLAWRWVLTQESVLADVAQCDRVLVVRYEDVCAEPLATTRTMFDFTGLAWHTQTERFIATSTQAASKGYYSIFKDSQASARRWRAELSPAAIDRILNVLRSSSLRRFYDDEGVRPAFAANEVVA